MKKLLITAIGALVILLASTAPVAAQPAGFCAITESCIDNVTSVCNAITGCTGIPPNLLPLTNTWTNTNTYDDDAIFDFDITAGSLRIGEDDDSWISYDGTFDMMTFSTGQAIGTYFGAFSPTATATNYGGAAFFSQFATGVSASLLVVAPDLNTSTNTMDGSDTWRVLEIDPGDHSDQDHTGAGNEFDGVDIKSVISPDADAEYHAITVGAGWDYTLVATVLASIPASPAANKVGLYIDEAIDRGSGTGTADCALIAQLSNGTEVVVSVLVSDGVCP